jgi:ribosomal protein S18 acetylase RimI-like enzyme
MFDRPRGWIARVSVRRPWRRRGIASALTAAGLRALRERGMTSAQLGVDSENPTGALGVYERLGFAVAERATTFRRPLE